MEANRTRTRWTYAEFARLPSEGAVRHEVIDGELYVTPAPSTGHQRVVGRLFTLLHRFAENNALGEVFVGPLDVLFAEGDYLEPDILFVDSEKAGLISDRGVEGPPDLVVEVTSPSTTARDRGIKLERYRLYGVAEYWVVDRESGTIDVWDLATGAEEPIVLGVEDVLPWTPVRGAETLEIDVGEVLGERGR